MSFWEILALVGTGSTILGVFLAWYARLNNKTIKEENRLTRELMDRMDRRHEDTSKEMAELLNEIRKGQEDARKEMAESFKYLGNLIVVEGERILET